MGYSSRRGRRPSENASKSAHSYVVKDPDVQTFLTQCDLPKKAADVSMIDQISVKYRSVSTNPIKHVIAVDGGFTEVVVEKEYMADKTDNNKPWFDATDRICPRCQSKLVIEIAQQLHCQACSYDHAQKRNVARTSIGTQGWASRGEQK